VGLPTFGFITCHDTPLADGVQREVGWMAQCAASGRAVAHLWQGAPGWAVPKGYTRSPRWDAALAALRASGTPIHVRASGGGLVPLGPGLLNLSLVWRSDHDATAPHATGAVYRGLCDALARALARMGLQCDTAAVPGAFCDGRFNLAVAGRKVAGTAQAWRRIEGRIVVLAHTVLIASADPDALTAQANRIEAALSREARYRAEAVTSIARAWAAARGVAPAAHEADVELRRVVSEQFARVVPPKALAD
jgi:lipoate-protein ligase A